MNMKPLTLLLALTVPAVHAGDIDDQLAEMAARTTATNHAYGSSFPEPMEYGTRTDVYFVDGELEVYESMSSDEDDELNFYDEYSAPY